MGFSVVKINRFPSIAVPGRRPFRLLFGDLAAVHGLNVDDGKGILYAWNFPIVGESRKIVVTNVSDAAITTVMLVAISFNRSERFNYFFFSSFFPLQMILFILHSPSHRLSGVPTASIDFISLSSTSSRFQ